MRSDKFWAGTPRQVYYAERDGLIKIGSSINPRQRARTLGAELLVVEEPGRFANEWAAHERFSHLRVDGEWFAPEPDLLRHMVSLVGNEPVANKSRRWSDIHRAGTR